MAIHNVAAGGVGTYNHTLSAGVVDSVNFTDDPDVIEVISDGTAAIYVTIDGTTPTVGGANTYPLPAAPCSRKIKHGGTQAVRLISAGTPTYGVAVTSGDPGLSLVPSVESSHGLPSTIQVKTATYTALVGDLVLADATGGAFTVTLPAGAELGDLVIVKNDGSANDVAVAGEIDGDAGGASITPGFGHLYESDGADAWLIVGVMGMSADSSAALADHIADTTAAHAATAISFAPNGSIAATTVQAAIVEVRDEAQPVDSDLTAIAALTTTAYGRALLALADAAAGRTALGLGTAALSASGDFQPIDADLTSIAALTTTSFGRGLLALADAAALLSAAGAQASDAELTALAGLTSAANKLPYFTGSGAAALADLTAFARTLLDDADAATMRVTLGAHPLGLNFGAPAAITRWIIMAAAATATLIYPEGDLYLGPLWLPDGWELDGIGWEVAVLGSVGSLTRAALYKDDGTGKPGALVLDSGQVDSTTATVKTVTGLASGVLSSPGGLYWGGVVEQGGAGTRATLRYVSSSGSQPVVASAAFTTLIGKVWKITGVTGAPPATGTTANIDTAGYPRIGVRRSV